MSKFTLHDERADAGDPLQFKEASSSRPPIRVADLFKIGIGPSSSHTMGPMKAAAAFVRGLSSEACAQVDKISVTVFGSLAWTGKGHATDKAIILGLAGWLPDGIEPEEVDRRAQEIRDCRQLELPSGRKIAFDPEKDIAFDKLLTFDRHPNAMQFKAFSGEFATLASDLWFSVGGGFIERDGHPDAGNAGYTTSLEYGSAEDLLALCRARSCSISDIALSNELACQDEEEVFGYVDRVIRVMMECIDRGLRQEGELPGGLRVKRRAPALYRRIMAQASTNAHYNSQPFDHISTFAIAVNEENAAGGRVVTAPTNGAAGVLPSVLRYYRDFCPAADEASMRTFLLTATAIGGIIKRNASLSGAEVGCQGEVGSAAAMASAGLAAALGGTNAQIENAAEIAIEHHLGMTCDPVGGLVQIPCIERNAFGAIKAVNSAYLALAGDGAHRVSLDQVIETMRQTGADMHSKYRETSRGGLAVNVPEC